MDLTQAIRERRERAIGVRRDYTVEYAGLQAWVVCLPEEEGRCYLVDMIARTCTCPDWHCTAQGLGIDCKHILAIEPVWCEFTGQKMPAFVRNGRPTSDSGIVAVPDLEIDQSKLPDDAFDENGRQTRALTIAEREAARIDPFATL